MQFFSPLRRNCCAVIAVCACTGAAAQTPTQELPEVLITGGPSARPDGTVAASKLAGDELVIRRKSSVGETLQQLPGVSSTYFGPNASRPSIRGLDGDRIRILQNGGASLDASALSFDHAVPIDPMSMDRIEVLRGSAALLYGGSAAGGVVNIIDSRIAREPLFTEKGGTNAMAGLSLGSHRTQELNAQLQTGNAEWVWHADGFSRSNGDVGTPRALCEDSSGQAYASTKICNSAQSASGAGVGMTKRSTTGYLGASFSYYNSQYGTVAEPAVRIGLRKQRMSIEGGQTFSEGWLESLKAQWNMARYTHTEWEGALAGSLFSNAGVDGRLDLVHREIRFGQQQAKLTGSVGLQWERNHFNAQGVEAYLPPSKTRQTALFWFEELSVGDWRYNAGLRAEQLSVQSKSGTQQPRSFSPNSTSAGATWQIHPNLEFNTSLAYSQRAPRDNELFANGPHVATAAWELGDNALGKEQSRRWEMGGTWKQGANRFSASIYSSNFSRYIALYRSGNLRGKDGELNPADVNQDGIADSSGEAIIAEYAYRAIRARLSGFEIQGKWRLSSTTPRWELDWQADAIRANNLDTGEALPRIAPARLGLGLSVQHDKFRARLGAMAHASQQRVPVGDTPTPGYVLWNLEASYQLATSRTSNLLWFARIENLSNTLAFSSSSILTQTAKGKAPLPGRTARVGVQGTW